MQQIKYILLLFIISINLKANIPSLKFTYSINNGNQEIYTYDTLNRLISLEHQNANAEVLASFTYTLSPIGERVEIVENNRSTSYNYDELSRVISENITDSKNGDYASSYTYDEVSNRIQSVIDGVTTQYNYDDNDRLLQQGGTVYTYDNQGNTLSQTLDYNSTNYSYNAKHQLVEVITDNDTINYSYNIKGIRTAKTKANKNIQYIVDSNRAYAQVMQEIEDDILAVSYTYGHDLLSQTRENKTYDYHYDGLGSARYLSDINGTLTDSYNYEAFGKLLNQEGNTTNNYKFTGEQLDEETQNYYLRARYFSPLRGGFTQQDTYMGNSSDPVTLHKYLYGNGNPVSNIDPSGYFSMMSVSSAMSLRNSLQNMQIENYITIGDIITNPQGAGDLSGIPAIAGTAVELRLLLRFSPKLQMACKNSFDGQTLVATENGLIPIEDIKIGDKVWAYNEANQSKSLQEVTHLIRGEGTKELVDIKLSSGEIITATSNHPFWEVEDSNWTEAGQLNTNSILFNLNDGNSTIASLKNYTLDTTVYNLTVRNEHTYFVGAEGVLGHNANYCSKVLVNEHIVRKALANSPYRTHQQAISIPKVSRLVYDMLNGKIRKGGMPSISVDGNIIIEGNHRYIASQIANFPLEIRAGTLAGYKKREPSHSISDLVLDAIDWGD